MRTLPILDREIPETKVSGCCAAGPTDHRPSANRYGTFLRWLVPGVALALLPKCPACFAMYFAAATGIGVAVSTAASLRIITMFACVAFPVVATLWPTLRSLHRRLTARRELHRSLVVR